MLSSPAASGRVVSQFVARAFRLLAHTFAKPLHEAYFPSYAKSYALRNFSGLKFSNRWMRPPNNRTFDLRKKLIIMNGSLRTSRNG
ncbi:hypothetical protein VN24_02160 [Paenibacillus beijingensis]|uniref:Uncharacterized protein n=1 Tax=Paenibacillus beijingensis TaxID=1126833 RepID=A0A0D5NFH1_9BACL|nr:hypothetical protein VN24_02160 [Paenibacillus beijingensis]